jgi:hypothetical protein
MKIPSRVRIKSKVFYNIVWQETIADDAECLGLCDPGTRTIFLKLNQAESEVIKTFIHEMIHALEAEYQTPIPHRIVYTLEEGIFRVLKLNGFIG